MGDKMIDVLGKIGMWVMAGIAAYVLYRWFSMPKEGTVSSYEQELKDILTSEKYKVKRRFED